MSELDLDLNELAEWVEAAYKRYYLAKALANPSGGYAYDSEVTKLIDWLKTGEIKKK